MLIQLTCIKQNFILKEKQIGGPESYYNIQAGFVEVLNNKVTVLVEGATEA